MRFQIGRRQLRRLHRRGHADEFHRPAGDLPERIHQLFGGEHTRLVVGKISLVSFVQRRRPGTRLVGAAVQDHAQQMASIVAGSGEVLRQGIEQLRIGRRVGIAEIIERFDNPAPHQIRPDAVRLDACEKRIPIRGEPIGESLAAVGAFGNV